MKTRVHVPSKPEIPDHVILSNIYLFHRKMAVLDRNLAALFEVETRTLNNYARRHARRFPTGSVMKLSYEEDQMLKNQLGPLKHGRYTKYLPLAYTEPAIVILGGLVRSARSATLTVKLLSHFLKLQTLFANAELIGFGKYWNGVTADDERVSPHVVKSLKHYN